MVAYLPPGQQDTLASFQDDMEPQSSEGEEEEEEKESEVEDPMDILKEADPITESEKEEGEAGDLSDISDEEIEEQTKTRNKNFQSTDDDKDGGVVTAVNTKLLMTVTNGTRSAKTVISKTKTPIKTFQTNDGIKTPIKDAASKPDSKESPKADSKSSKGSPKPPSKPVTSESEEGELSDSSDDLGPSTKRQRIDCDPVSDEGIV